MHLLIAVVHGNTRTSKRGYVDINTTGWGRFAEEICDRSVAGPICGGNLRSLRCLTYVAFVLFALCCALLDQLVL